MTVSVDVAVTVESGMLDVAVDAQSWLAHAGLPYTVRDSRLATVHKGTANYRRIALPTGLLTPSPINRAPTIAQPAVQREI